MAICQLTGKKKAFGHNVSHSKRRTNRTFKSNIHTYNFVVNGRKVKLTLSTKGLRYVDKHGIEKALDMIQTRRENGEI
jgi:large subunit ribosomal protein L28